MNVEVLVRLVFVYRSICKLLLFSNCDLCSSSKSVHSSNDRILFFVKNSNFLVDKHRSA